MPLHILEISHKQCSFRSNIFSRFLSQLCIFQLTLYDPAIYKIILWTLHSFSNAMKSKMLIFLQVTYCNRFSTHKCTKSFPMFRRASIESNFQCVYRDTWCILDGFVKCRWNSKCFWNERFSKTIDFFQKHSK